MVALQVVIAFGVHAPLHSHLLLCFLLDTRGRCKTSVEVKSDRAEPREEECVLLQLQVMPVGFVVNKEYKRNFYTLTVADDKYDTALQALRNFFTPKVNVVAERYRFHQRSQRVGETTNQFVAALRELVTTCQFGNMEEEMIRDQIMEKAKSARIRERLLLEILLTLTKALAIARQIETAVAEAKAMCSEPTEGSVQVIYQKPQQSRKPMTGKYTPSLPSPTGLKIACYGCGSTQHKNKGHFAKVCRGSKRVSEVKAVPEVTILNVNSDGSNSIMCTNKISIPDSACQDIELMLDTGSAVSILPESVVTDCFPEVSLQEPKIKLRDYSGNPIAVKGCLQALAAFKDRNANTVLCIVKNGLAVLGRDLLFQLHMQMVKSLQL